MRFPLLCFVSGLLLWSLLLVLTSFGVDIASAADRRARPVLAGPVPITVLKVRDGDTLEVVAHVWPGHDITVAVRLRGVDAPERAGRCARERVMARAARDRLVALVAAGKLHLHDVSGGKYFGRVLARLRVDGADAGAVLLAEGLVRPYRGGRRTGWCDTALAGG